jgi:hypothetical protein
MEIVKMIQVTKKENVRLRAGAADRDERPRCGEL